MENHIVNRQTKSVQQIPVMADRWMRILYQTLPGHAALWLFVKRKWVSSLYARYARRKKSKKAADRIVSTYGLDMAQFPPYSTYEEFFTRALPTIEMPSGNKLGAMAECFISCYENIDIQALFDVKGEGMRLEDILQSEELAQRYSGGTLIRFRLAPHHYHHLHHFDDAKITMIRDISGGYYSVNPMAVDNIIRLYCKNKRRLVEMRTKRFQTVMLVEVGATMVGSIVNPFKQGDDVHIGEDGGYFAPGGSMLLLLFEKGSVTLDEDLLINTRNGLETMISLSEIIGEGDKGW